MSGERIEAIVLAGGMGTRLRSVVSDVPKPLAPVAGRPFLEWLLLSLGTQGVRRVVLATGYMGEKVHDYFGDGARLGLDIRYAWEDAPLGTGGAARNALDATEGTQVLVVNGDSFCHCDLGALLRAHGEAGARATLCLTRVDDCGRYGAVDVDPPGWVMGFREKETYTARAGLINAGIYVCERAVLQTLPVGEPSSLETDLFPRLVGAGLYATLSEGPFLDIGTPASYARAEDFLARTVERGFIAVPGLSATER